MKGKETKYRKKNKERIAKSRREYDQKQVKNLSDSYIKKLIVKRSSFLTSADITPYPDFIEARRMIVKARRLAREFLSRK
jgi:hypothetical protein